MEIFKTVILSDTDIKNIKEALCSDNKLGPGEICLVKDRLDIAQPLSYSDWADVYSDSIYEDLEKRGITREFDYNPEKEFEQRHEKYLEECKG